MARAADALTTLRLVAAALMPVAIARGGALPVALWVYAAASDFLDGPLARRGGGGSRYGAVVDPLSDIAFVLATFGTLAAAGRVPWIVPAAVAASAGAYGVAAVRARGGGMGLRGARSRLGHAAGVVNYAAAGIWVAMLAWPGAPLAGLGAAANLAVVLVNLGAVADRSWRGELAGRAT